MLKDSGRQKLKRDPQVRGDRDIVSCDEGGRNAVSLWQYKCLVVERERRMRTSVDDNNSRKRGREKREIKKKQIGPRS